MVTCVSAGDFLASASASFFKAFGGAESFANAEEFTQQSRMFSESASARVSSRFTCDKLPKLRNEPSQLTTGFVETTDVVAESFAMRASNSRRNSSRERIILMLRHGSMNTHSDGSFHPASSG